LRPAAVGIQRERHDRRQPRQLADLFLGERGPHDRDAVADAGLVHRDDVGVALGDDDAARLRRGRAGDVGAEELAALVEEIALRAVDVLRPAALAVVGERPPGEPAHAPAGVGQREDDLRAEAVVELAGLL
jgi:hypothetical protein